MLAAELLRILCLFPVVSTLEPETEGILMIPISKQQWRQRILTQRRSVDDATRASEALKLSQAAAESVRGMSAVAAYVPVGSEPGSLDLLDALRRRTPLVLVPIARVPGPLYWAEYTGRGSLKAAPYGLSEPTGDVLDPATVNRCDLVFVPALAVDIRGVRLGRGAGFYDRTLDFVDSGTPIVAIVRDAEFVDELPEEPHDRRASHALTPSGGLMELAGE